MPVNDARSCDDVIKAYLTQIESVQRAGGQIILMASRARSRGSQRRERLRPCIGKCCRLATNRSFFTSSAKRSIRNWPPLLGHADFENAAKVCLEVIAANEAKVDGIKISLLHDTKEIELRRRLRLHP